MDGEVPAIFLCASYWMWGKKIFLAYNVGLTKRDRRRVRRARERRRTVVVSTTQE